MSNILKNLFGLGQKADLGELIMNGAIIIDVRTPGEYASGHIKNSVNIPLNILPSRLAKLKKDKPVITCCASGMRSGTARNMLIANGFEQVHNGGSWYNLRKYEK
ncbi:MAG TPA: rhodanese-like domain-containing protein [Mucilaginibacter sp.]|nr:rhodanese-like domain-containing protein [Mucilaginibacter sp.]